VGLKTDILQLKIELKRLKDEVIPDRRVRLIRHKQFAGWFPNAGRLQVWRKGEWGGVCGDNLDNRDARVACRELGFSWGNVTTSEDAKTAIGGGRIWLD